MRYTAPVYEYVCPKCLACMGDACTRVRKTKRAAPYVLTYAHKERYVVWHAWEEPRLPFNAGE